MLIGYARVSTQDQNLASARRFDKSGVPKGF